MEAATISKPGPYVAVHWTIHAPTTIRTQIDGAWTTIAECSGHGREAGHDEQDARRIAAALNACQGVSTDVLEGMSMGFIGATVPYHVMKKQHAEMLDALKKCVSMLIELGGSHLDHKPQKFRQAVLEYAQSGGTAIKKAVGAA